MFAAILAIIKAIPAIKGLVDEFIAFYVQQQIASMQKAVVDGIRKAVDGQDQRDLEKAIGSTKAGELSGIAGTSIVSDLPGVPNQSKN